MDWSANFPDSDFVVNATPANYFQYEPRCYERSDDPLLPASVRATMLVGMPSMVFWFFSAQYRAIPS